jgi:hypothetical protein
MLGAIVYLGFFTYSTASAKISRLSTRQLGGAPVGARAFYQGLFFFPGKFKGKTSQAIFPVDAVMGCRRGSQPAIKAVPGELENLFS